MTVTPDALVGRVVVDVVQTKWSGGKPLLPGLRPAWYCAIVLKLDGGELFELTDDGLTPWTRHQGLRTIARAEHPHVAPHAAFAGKRIRRLGRDQTSDMFVVELEDGLTIDVEVAYGTSLRIATPG